MTSGRLHFILGDNPIIKHFTPFILLALVLSEMKRLGDPHRLWNQPKG